MHVSCPNHHKHLNFAANSSASSFLAGSPRAGLPMHLSNDIYELRTTEPKHPHAFSGENIYKFLLFPFYIYMYYCCVGHREKSPTFHLTIQGFL